MSEYRKGNENWRVEISSNYRYRLCGISIKTRHSRKNIGFSLNVPYIVSFYFYFRLPGVKTKKELDCSLSFHNQAMWWQFFTPWGEWSSKTPKWRHGSFHFDDFFMGKSKCTVTLESEGEWNIDMPEGLYRSTYKIENYVWKRSRWPFKKTRRSINFDIPGCIPHDGKGENSWDCGMDGTCGIGENMSNHDSIGSAADRVSIRCLETRIKYGRLHSFTPELLSKESYIKEGDFIQHKK